MPWCALLHVVRATVLLLHLVEVGPGRWHIVSCSVVRTSSVASLEEFPTINASGCAAGRGYVMFPLSGWTTLVRCRRWNGTTDLSSHSVFFCWQLRQLHSAFNVNAIIYATAVAKSTQRGSSRLYLVEHADHHVQSIMSVMFRQCKETDIGGLTQCSHRQRCGGWWLAPWMSTKPELT